MKILVNLAVALTFAASPAWPATDLLTPLEEEMATPAIDAPDLAGVTRTLADFSGKVAIVNFWATWCPPCVSELASMQALWDRFRDRSFAMVAVNVGEDRWTVSEFLDMLDTQIDFAVLLDEELAVVKRWPVFGLPTSFVIGTDGSIVYKVLGERDWMDGEIVGEIEALLDGRQNAATMAGKSNAGINSEPH